MNDKLAEHSIRENVFLTRPGGRAWKDGHYAVVCKTCKSEQPKHTEDCEVAALEAKLSKMEEALMRAAEKYGEVGAPEVHRVWRDTMLKQERRVSDEKIDWRGLPLQDIYLDERIARAVAKDFLIWAFGHEEALAGGDDESEID